MSGKSKLKTDIFRHEPFRDALRLTDLGMNQVPEDVRVVFDDASVVFARGATGTGARLLESFLQPIQLCFSRYPNVHTYILCFDKRQYVPNNKSDTQQDRRKALDEQIRRRNVPPWSWDGTSSIVEYHKELPAWDRLRQGGRRVETRALTELISMIALHAAPPAGRRLVIDWLETGPVAIETDTQGHVLEMYTDTSLTNTIGEADMAAQWYAKLGRTGKMEVPARPAVLTCRTPSSLVPQPRPVFEAGSVFLKTVDTDYLPLSILHFGLPGQSGQPHAEHLLSNHPHNVYVGLGVTYVDPAKGGTFCTRTTAGASPVSEVYDVRRLINIIIGKICISTELLHSIVSFVTFCFACGNDYVKRFNGLSHRTMFETYLHTKLSVDITLGTESAPTTATIDQHSFVAFYRDCYRERMKTFEYGTNPSWETVSALVKNRYNDPRSHMPTQQEMHTAYTKLLWCLSYSTATPPQL